MRRIVEVLASTFPAARIERDADDIASVPPGGMLVVRDGEGGAPMQLLGGAPEYIVRTPVTIEVYAAGATAAERFALADDMVEAAAEALSEDVQLRSLGLQSEMELESVGDVTVEGGRTVRSMALGVTYLYSATSAVG